MNKKAVVAAGVGVVLAGVAVVGGAVVTGIQTKKALQAAPQAWPMVKVVDQKYSQGLFSSTQTLTLQIGCAGPAAPPAFTVQQRIKHGPLPGFSSFGAAVIDSELVVPESARKALDEITGGQPPIKVHTLVGFAGGVRSQVTMPAFSFRGPKGEQLSFQGLQAEVSGNADALHYELSMPGLNLAGRDERMAVEMRLDGLKARGDLGAGHSLWLRPGKSEGEMASLEFSAMNQVASPVPPVRFALSQVRMSSDTTLADSLVASTTRMTGQGTLGSVKLDKIELQASIKRLHAPTYEKMMQHIVDSSGSCDAQAAANPQVLMQQLQQDLAALLPFGPAYSLDKLALDIDGKHGELSYLLGIAGVTDADLQTPLPALIMSKGQFSGQANLPGAWVEKTMASFGGGQQDPVAQAELMSAMLGKMANEGYVVREGEMLKAQMSFDKGQLLVNGKPLARP